MNMVMFYRLLGALFFLIYIVIRIGGDPRTELLLFGVYFSLKSDIVEGQQ